MMYVTDTRFRFQSPDSSQTLQEGLAEYFQAHADMRLAQQLVSCEARQFFRSHDIVHVLYGCGTSMSDEAVVKIASLFGTTGGVRVLLGYVHHETLRLYCQIPVRGALHAILLSPYLVVRTVFRCLAQRQRWPWAENEKYMDVRLDELRATFGIRVGPRRQTRH